MPHARETESGNQKLPSDKKMDLGKCLVLTHPARLGDSVLSLPLHRAIAQRFPLESNIGEPFRFLLELAGIDAAYSGPLYPKGARALFQEARRLRERQFRTVFLVRPNFRSALLAYLARIPIRVGDTTEGRAALLNHRVDVPARSNQIERLRAFGAAVALDVPPIFGLPTSPKLDPPTVGIVPAASYSDKIIPPEALRFVCHRLLDLGYRLALLGGPGQEPWSEPFQDIPAEDWVGRYSLPDLIAPLSSLRALVAADGGLYHLAVGCGVPSVGVYGPTKDKYWWHAWGDHVPVLAEGGEMSSVTGPQVWDAVSQTLKVTPSGDTQPAPRKMPLFSPPP